MPLPENFLNPSLPKVVGSFGSAKSLMDADFSSLAEECDIIEIRLDLLKKDLGEVTAAAWAHLRPFPMLFTARRIEEGGALPLSAEERMELLRLCVADSALIDIEVASIGEMAPLLTLLNEEEIPWIASYHDFGKLPDRETLDAAAAAAKAAHATVFKVAAHLSGPEDQATLADYQLTEHGIFVSSMGMGPLAPVSRQLLAQCGSVLNYGYLGDIPTAPGQWDSKHLKQSISKLVPFTR